MLNARTKTSNGSGSFNAALVSLLHFVAFVVGKPENGGMGIYSYNGGVSHLRVVVKDDDGGWRTTEGRYSKPLKLDATGMTDVEWDDFWGRMMEAYTDPKCFKLLANLPEEWIEVETSPATAAAPTPTTGAGWMISGPPAVKTVKPCPSRQKKGVMSAWLVAESTAVAAAAAMTDFTLEQVKERLAGLATGKQGDLKRAVEAVEATLAQAGLLAS